MEDIFISQKIFNNHIYNYNQMESLRIKSTEYHFHTFMAFLHPTHKPTLFLPTSYT